MGSYDYITYRLTGALSVEGNWALEAGFYSLVQGGIDEDLVRLGGIAPDQFARRSGPRGEPAGAVTPQAADETGLVPGTPVVTGCADHIASAFVAGACDQGDLVVKFGGAGGHHAHLRAGRWPTRACSCRPFTSCRGSTSPTAAWRRAAAC